ncbi:hypothetical protein MMC30_005740 [Trapelia coarctata]|nr:hypothetical protein [Trapelia coarctata]
MLSPAILGQTITVYDKSNKVVSNSKHLFNVFKEAKSAYRERKAEISVARHAHGSHKTLKSPPIDDRRSYHTQDPHHRKPVPSRRNSGGSVVSGSNSVYPASNRRFEQDLRSHTHLHRSPTSPRSPRSPHGVHSELARRHTSIENPPSYHSAPPSPTRSYSANEIDMNLAYGEMPLDLMHPRTGDEAELKAHVGTVKRILQEADCVHYSVTAIIASLQKNPEAMAAVALTLAEISNIVSKMSPGVLMALKGSSPAVFALLASPQFLICAGVGVGVTIVALGGYKIIKKIKAKNALEADEARMEEMLVVGSDLGRIENWRRGISKAAEGSVGTSVEGEFITPMAAGMSRLSLQEERIRESRMEARGLMSVGGSLRAGGSRAAESSRASSRREKSERRKREKGEKSERGKAENWEKEKKKKEKKPSPLRAMFR